MTTVFTRKHKHPRTTTLLDFRNFESYDPPQTRVLSPTRLSNPHPIGLNHQNIPSTSVSVPFTSSFSYELIIYRIYSIDIMQTY